MDTKNIKDFPEILQINNNTRLLGIGNNNVGDGAKITIDRLMSQSISPSENNLLSLDDNNKLFVPKNGEIVFNNPFAFGDFKYSDHIISNLSWLRSNGQRNSGTFYERYYNWLLALYNGEETVAGISVKSVSDSSATDYDFKIDTNSREFILPTETILHPIDSSVNAPVVGNGMSLGLTNGTNNAGLFKISGSELNLTAGYYGTPVSSTATSQSGLNGVIGVTTDPTKSGIEAKLSTAKATAYLYYFVGDVIQGANVIDVVRLEEQITEVSNTVSGRIYIKDAYKSGTEGYRIWSDGYGEQWGEQTADSVTFIKKFKDVNYNLTRTLLGYSTSGTGVNVSFLSVSTGIATKETDGFTGTVHSSYNLNKYMWKACGYLAEGEY